MEALGSKAQSLILSRGGPVVQCLLSANFKLCQQGVISVVLLDQKLGENDFFLGCPASRDSTRRCILRVLVKEE